MVALNQTEEAPAVIAPHNFKSNVSFNFSDLIIYLEDRFNFMIKPNDKQQQLKVKKVLKTLQSLL